MALKNPAREKLKKGELSLGVGLRQARTVDIAMAMKTASKPNHKGMAKK